MGRPSPWKHLGEIAGVAALYYGMGRLGLLLAIPPGYATAIFPASGIALAAILLRGPGVWPGIWLGSFLLNTEVSAHTTVLSLVVSIAVPFVIGAGSTLQAQLGAYLIRRFITAKDLFEKPKNVFAFTAIEAISCFVAPTFGATTLCLAGLSVWQNYPYTWVTWWLGDLAGILILTPLLFLWSFPVKWAWTHRRQWEWCLFLILLILSAELIFGGPFGPALSYLPLKYSLIPFVIWAAFRFGQREMPIVILIASVLAVEGAAYRYDFLAHYFTLDQTLLFLQAYISITAVMGLSLAAAVGERRASAEEVKKYAEALKRSNQELEDFAYVISHDLQEPLAKVIAFGDLLNQQIAPTPEAVEKCRDYVGRMQNASFHMSELLDGLLKYSRVTFQTKPQEPLDLQAILNEVLSDLEMRIKTSGAKIEMDVDLAFKGDKLQMRQLFQNLIGNAIKYSKKDVTPLIKVKARRLDGKTAEIRVEDNGIGFDEKHAEEIFKPFKRLRKEAGVKGAGMGLAICKKIVEHHAGTIHAKSVPNQGSSFIIMLSLNE